MMDKEVIAMCQSIAKEIRKDVIRMTFSTGKKGAHIGGGLSMCEILSVLYMHVLNIDISNLNDIHRDRFILSKGHGAIALYAAMVHKNILSREDLDTFKHNGSEYWTHPQFLPEKGFEFASGSLGLGLGLGAGTAIALKRKGLTCRVYVYLGDGECDEGAVWEAASFIAHHNLDNVTVIIDENKLQLDAPTKEIINKDYMADRWRAFGFDVVKSDGHSIESLLNAFAHKSQKPIAIIAETVKGKGVSFMENNPAFHTGIISQEQFDLAMAEQGRA